MYQVGKHFPRNPQLVSHWQELCGQPELRRSMGKSMFLACHMANRKTNFGFSWSAKGIIDLVRLAVCGGWREGGDTSNSASKVG